MGDYERPKDLSDALSVLAAGRRMIVAGATDVFATVRASELAGPVLDLTAVEELRSISSISGGLRIGACVTWDAVARAALPPAFRALQMAARQVGGRQVQNAGTIAGNICNASPAADGVPPLLVLDARVEIESAAARREMPLADFLTGPRRTALQPGEMVTAILIPAPAQRGQSVFLKLGARAHLVISIASAAARIVEREGVIADAAIAVGASGPVPRRLPALEDALVGRRLAEAAGAVDAATVTAALSPIDDIRASAAYRREAAVELVRQALAALSGRAP